MVTIAGGTHTYPSTSVQTGYDYPTAVWGFFSRYLSDNAGAPRIAARPVDNVQQSGMPASFRVTALGDEPLQYQWQRNGVDMPGATADWYTLPAATPADDGATFRAIVTNAAGTATSETAKLKVLAATAGPSIDAAPTDQVVVAGQTVRFTVSTTSADAQGFWQQECSPQRP